MKEMMLKTFGKSMWRNSTQVKTENLVIIIEWKRSRHLGERDRHTETEIGREKQSTTYRETERARERKTKRER